jgi:hypothetical protein
MASASCKRGARVHPLSIVSNGNTQLIPFISLLDMDPFSARVPTGVCKSFFRNPQYLILTDRVPDS